jgi:hypothetical protein
MKRRQGNYLGMSMCTGQAENTGNIFRWLTKLDGAVKFNVSFN